MKSRWLIPLDCGRVEGGGTPGATAEAACYSQQAGKKCITRVRTSGHCATVESRYEEGRTRKWTIAMMRRAVLAVALLVGQVQKTSNSWSRPITPPPHGLIVGRISREHGSAISSTLFLSSVVGLVCSSRTIHLSVAAYETRLIGKLTSAQAATAPKHVGGSSVRPCNTASL